MTVSERGVAPVWDPKQYEKFAGERSRPFRELVARIDHPGARSVVDLGCGPGTLTAELAARWPAATVEGIDSSAEMIADASELAIAGRLSFEQADLRDWRPEQPVDVLVTNATLQWVPRHLELLASLAAYVAKGGYFAFQVPGNFEEPSHRLLADLRASDRWRGALAGQPERPAGVHTPAEYLAALQSAGLSADVWETTYMQVLTGSHAVLEWMKGTALRPTLSALSPSDQELFIEQFGDALAVAYPETVVGTVLPFRRIFAVAKRDGGADERGVVERGAVAALDHVQIAIPAGGEEQARGFYKGVLGLAENPKPANLAKRGGCWFAGHRAELHVGVDPEFRPAEKAHVALAIVGLDALAGRLIDAGYKVVWDEELAPLRRFYSFDPFGNRIELMQS
jgi:trans-aconitate 2-methyltransferase